MKSCRNMLFVLLVLAVTSCAQSPAPQTAAPAEPMYSQDVLSVRLTADSQLNLYSGASHALHLCLYQLIDSNAFNQLSENPAGIAKLMNCDRFEPSMMLPGMAIGRKVVVQPGETQTFKLDRADGARYLGVVAGYYNLQKRNAIRLFQLPPTPDQQRGQPTLGRQAPTNFELYLGPQGIDQSGERR